ncbi:MAG: glycosyltransferase family A protein, partial [Candidatus Thermoplasmatota archaeon]|nr:glycosyltransferase family A protein [Candidatus Thermoplasmatota archaeon]
MTLVSITVCAKNAENWVHQCLSSLFSQDYRPLEIIAVNDGSTDSTFERMKLFKEKNQTSDINLTIIDSDGKGLSAGR